MSLFSSQWSVVSGQKAKICFLLPIACLLLSSCGFHPVYGTATTESANSPINEGITLSVSASGTSSTSNNLTIDDSATKSMVRQFTNNLEDMVSSSDAPTYRLEVAINQNSVGVGVARDGTAARYNLMISSTYRLIRISDNKEVDKGSVNNVTSYNNPNNQYFSTFVSEQDARKRGIKELAEIYRQRLIAFTDKKFPATLPLSTPPQIDETCPKVC